MARAGDRSCRRGVRDGAVAHSRSIAMDVARTVPHDRGLTKMSAAICLAGAIGWTAMVTADTLGPYLRARRAMRDGAASVVEGRVENFHPMPDSGHDTERFTVGNVHFAYSDYSMGAGFDRTSSHGGPIREGLRVRIHFIGSREPMIAKLEIEQ